MEDPLGKIKSTGVVASSATRGVRKKAKKVPIKIKATNKKTPSTIIFARCSK
jgi:hypothetical protein